MIGHNSNRYRSYSSIILAIILDGATNDSLVVLVREDSKELPIYWKLPGGGVDSSDGNDPKKTGKREFKEETGIERALEDFKLLLKENKNGYDRYLFVTFICARDISSLERRGVEGEIIDTFKLSELETMLDFLPVHKELLNKKEVKKAFKKAVEGFLNKK